MTFLPIIERELRTAAKRPMTYYFRCITAGIAIIVTLGLLFGTFIGAMPTASLGRTVLVWLGVIGYLYAALEGALITCDCLTEEKREGTIGLLFLTHLHGYDIVLSKMVARSWHAFGAILAAVPAPALTFLIGGVNFADFFQLMAALLSTLLFFAAVGMFFSACCRSGLVSTLASLGTILLTWMALAAFGFTSTSLPEMILQALGAVLAMPNIMMLTALADLDPTIAAFATKLTLINTFGPAFLFTNSLSLLLLAGASWALPRNWKEKATSGPRPPLLERLRAALGFDKFDRPCQPQAFSALLLSVNPSLRMAERRFRLSFSTWGISQIIFLLWIWGGARRYPYLAGMLMGASVLLWHYLLKFRVALQASRALAEDRRDGGLELLLTTGLDVDEIIRGHLLALKRQFLMPVLTVLAADAALVLMLAFDLKFWETMGAAASIAMFAFAQLADMYTLAWLGLWHGLKQANVTAALRRVMFHAVLGQLTTHLGTFVLFWALLNKFRPEFALAVVFVLIIGLAANLSYCCQTYTQLHDLFRSTAADSVAPRTPSRGWRPIRNLLARLRARPATRYGTR